MNGCEFEALKTNGHSDSAQLWPCTALSDPCTLCSPRAKLAGAVPKERMPVGTLRTVPLSPNAYRPLSKEKMASAAEPRSPNAYRIPLVEKTPVQLLQPLLSRAA